MSDVTEMSSGGLRAVEVDIENMNFVALPLDDSWRCSDLAVKDTVILTATAPVPHADLSEGVIGG
jgi:hypothetical protein